MHSGDRFFYNHLGFYFHLLSRQYLSLMMDEMEKWKIERAFLPLLIIHDSNGQINQHELSKTLLLDKVSTNRIINYLFSAGFVTKKTCLADKRKTLLEITPKGSKLLGPIKAAITKTNSLLMKNLKTEEQSELFNILEKVAINVAEVNNEKIK